MEFVSVYKDMLTVVGTVESTRDGRGIQMSLPEESNERGATFEISRIVYGENKSGKRYIETVSLKNSNWRIYGEASIPEILAFAEKAWQDMPESSYTRELSRLAVKIRAAFGIS